CHTKDGEAASGGRQAEGYFFISSFFIMPSPFFMLSLDIVSFFIMPSLDMDSFFMPSSLPILSWAKAAGASARLSETTAADAASAMRVLMVMLGGPLETGLKATDAAINPTDLRSSLLPVVPEYFSS